MKIRQKKVADEIRDILAEQLSQGKLSDPRVSGVFVTAVHVTADLQIAKIYYRSYSQDISDESLAAMKSGLRSCSGYLRCVLAEKIKLRRIPELNFFYDESIDRGMNIENIIRKMKT